MLKGKAITTPQVQDGVETTVRLGRRRSPAPASIFLGLGTITVGIATSGLAGSLGQTMLFVLGVATLAALISSVFHRHPSHVMPWILIAVAFLLFVLAAVVRGRLHPLGNLTETRSLLPDLLALPGYALLAFGLLGFSRAARRRGLQSSVILDGLIAALALAVLAWQFIFEPVLVHQHAPLGVKLVLIAYPSMSIFLVVVTLRFAFDPEQERTPAIRFMLVAMTLMFAGDAIYMLVELGLLRMPANMLDLPYALAFLGAGATSLHPSMNKLTEPGRPIPVTTSRGRIAVVAIALVIPALLSLRGSPVAGGDRLVVFLLVLVLSAAAVVRIVQALRTAQQSEARLSHQATHDNLTGLPNRRLMEQHVSRLLDRHAVDDTDVALLFLDLDRFKLVNDTLGHTHGDALLVEVATRLRRSVRSTDLVSRIGGDEFMVVLDHMVSVSQAMDLANRLRSALSEPFEINGTKFFITASIGLAYASGDDRDATAEALIRDADTAMYQVKEAGRDAVAIFDESMRTRVSERVELEYDLHRAITEHQLHLVYQPIVRLPRGSAVGVEALLRWVHPTRGVIAPAQFIPLAEDCAMIGEIGDWVLNEAAGQLAAWRRQESELDDLYVSVNLSGAQLYDDRIVDRVAEVLAVHGLEGSSLCLELTESVVMEDPLDAASTLGKLRKLGVQVALDDFGSEYSSLAYLKRFPTTMLKIDKSFVECLDYEDGADATLVAAVVAMARALSMATTAEGVETPAQAARVAELGCDAAQGYLYSRPVGPEAIPEVVAALSQHTLRLVRA